MMWSSTYVLIAVTIYGGVEVKTSGIDKLFKDDYKVLKRVYAKTSDKDIYGEILPASVTDTGDKKKSASEKKERYVSKYNDPDSIEYDSSKFGDYYSVELNKKSQKLPGRKPAKSTNNFVKYSNSKPISHASDPETYNFLRHLEDYENEEQDRLKSVGGFKHYSDNGLIKSEGTDTYESIQDILNSHEKGKRNGFKYEDDELKYSKSPKNKKKKPPQGYNVRNKPRCFGVRCRQRGLNYYKPRRRPYRRIPGVKKVVVM